MLRAREVLAVVSVTLDLTELVEKADALEIGRAGYSKALGGRIAEVIVARLESLDDEIPVRPKIVGDIKIEVRMAELDEPRNPVINVTVKREGAAR